LLHLDIVYDDSRNLSKIRNSGARVAEGEIILTLDADSTMSENLLEEVDQALSSGRYYGGGVMLKLERYSAGIILTALMFLPVILWHRVSAGCLWCYRRDFEAIGGFNENLLSFEDVDFAIRLKAYGRSQGKKTKVLTHAYIRTSCRKFDMLGDWYFVKRPWLLISLMGGENRQAADRLWYEVER